MLKTWKQDSPHQYSRHPGKQFWSPTVALRTHTWEAHDDKITPSFTSKCNSPTLPTSALLCSPVGRLLHTGLHVSVQPERVTENSKPLSFPEAVTRVLSHTLHSLNGSRWCLSTGNNQRIITSENILPTEVGEKLCPSSPAPAPPGPTNPPSFLMQPRGPSQPVTHLIQLGLITGLTTPVSLSPFNKVYLKDVAFKS